MDLAAKALLLEQIEVRRLLGLPRDFDVYHSNLGHVQLPTRVRRYPYLYVKGLNDGDVDISDPRAVLAFNSSTLGRRLLREAEAAWGTLLNMLKRERDGMLTSAGAASALSVSPRPCLTGGEIIFLDSARMACMS